jgi:hypothetical protein
VVFAQNNQPKRTKCTQWSTAVLPSLNTGRRRRKEAGGEQEEEKEKEKEKEKEEAELDGIGWVRRRSRLFRGLDSIELVIAQQQS